MILFAFVLALLALTAVTVHFFTNILTLADPSLKTFGLIDVGLAGSGLAGAAADLGINPKKLWP